MLPDTYRLSDNVQLCPTRIHHQKYLFDVTEKKHLDSLAQAEQSPLVQLLRYSHNHFDDNGLRYNLIHRMFNCSDDEVHFYVCELVYIAIRRKCRAMRKLLISKASSSQALRRLILWNVKAFTVLMKSKDTAVRESIEEFEEKLMSTADNRNKFMHAERAIAMLATASLVLKKLPPQTMKPQLIRFIRRFNNEYLANLQHSIMIPFRKGVKEDYHSVYLVRIIDEECSCFPTRKRVPYRIILQLIDPRDMNSLRPNDNLLKKSSRVMEPEDGRDLFQEVTELVSQTHADIKFKSLLGASPPKPFAIDQEEGAKMIELAKYFNQVVAEEKREEVKKIKEKSKLTRMMSMSGKRSSMQMRSNLAQLMKPAENVNLTRFDSTYIATIPSNGRMSESQNLRSPKPKGRYSDTDESKTKSKAKVVEQESILHDSHSIWGLNWKSKVKKYSESSPFSKFKSLSFKNVVVKGGDDLRQEIICMQLIYKMEEILNDAGLNVFLRPYEIIVLSQNSGLLQFVPNSMSVDAMKKEKKMNINDFFEFVFETEMKLAKAKENFLKSFVGSSILTYVLKLKDRHNGNILLDSQGHIIHIDFGFILGLSPGGINFQSSPFKFTEEYLQLLGGKQCQAYSQFCTLFIDGMVVLRSRSDELALILEIMLYESDLECFKDFKIADFLERFELSMSEADFRHHCRELIEKSCLNNRTVHYDYFQQYTNKIAP